MFYCRIINRKGGKILNEPVIEKRKVTLDGFSFVGRAARTTNEAEMTEEGMIPKVNEYFFENQLLEKISHRKNNNIIALYTNYESDEKGSYEYAVGCEVGEDNILSDEMKRFTIPEQKYIVFTTKKGPLNEVILEAWQFIWNWSKDNKRAFTADFELYDEKSIDPQNGQADIYISVK